MTGVMKRLKKFEHSVNEALRCFMGIHRVILIAVVFVGMPLLMMLAVSLFATAVMLPFQMIAGTFL